MKTAPGVLAVKVDYDSARATVGTKAGTEVSRQGLLSALESIGYSGKLVEED